MTLVAYHAFKQGNLPVLVSDVVLAVRRTDEGATGAPVPSGATAAGDSEHRVSGLGQKIVIIGPHLVVAYAGDRIEGAMFCREFRQRVEGSSPSPEELKEAMNQIVEVMIYQDHDLTDLSLLIVAFTPGQGGITMYVTTPAGPLQGCASSWFNEVVAMGSGAADYLALVGRASLDSSLSVGLRGKSSPSTLPSPEAYGIASALGPLGRFLCKEITTGRGHLAQAWGGWYEITALVGGRFQKLDRVAFVILTTQFRDGLAAIELSRIFRTEYAGDHLFVRAVSVAKRDGDSQRILSDEVFHAPPVLGTARPPTPKLDLNDYDWLCVASSFEGPGGGDASVCLLYASALVDGPIGPSPNVFKEDGDRLRAWCQPEFWDGIARAVWANETARPSGVSVVCAMRPTDYRRSILVQARLQSRHVEALLAQGKVVLVADNRDALASRIIGGEDPAPSTEPCPIRTVTKLAGELAATIPNVLLTFSVVLPMGYVRVGVVAAGGIEWFVCWSGGDFLEPL